MKACPACGSTQPPVLGPQGWPVCPSCGYVHQAWAPPPGSFAQAPPYGSPPGKVPGAVLALVMGILAFVTWFFGIIFAGLAIVFGVKGRKAARENPHLSGGGMATAGMVLGIVYLALVPLIIMLAAMTFVLVQNLDVGTGEPPSMAFTKDNSQGTIMVIKAPVDRQAIVYINDLSWRGDCSLIDLNGRGPPTNADTVVAGDRLGTDCLPGDRISLVHVPTGSLVYIAQFT